MKIWKQPHINKVYEALTAVSTGRLELLSDRRAKCHASAGNKSYDVSWTADFSEMMSNDNSAFYKGELSYPMIAVMLATGRIAYDHKLAAHLAGVIWKDINTKTGNNWGASVDLVLAGLGESGVDTKSVQVEAERIYMLVCDMKVEKTLVYARPPVGY
jgi:hypothetical protein